MNNLRKFRKERGLSQLNLSFMTEIPPSDISRIENGWLVPYPGWCKRLSMVLGIPETELFPESKRLSGNHD
jgi:ribosome-binding protein aMBF1 (putative translation factor)